MICLRTPCHGKSCDLSWNFIVLSRKVQNPPELRPIRDKSSLVLSLDLALPTLLFFKKILSKIWLWYKLVYKVGKERVFEGTGYSSRSALDPGNPVSKRFQATIRKMTKMHYCTVALYWYYMATKAISGNFTPNITFSSRVAPSQLKKPRGMKKWYEG